MTPGIKQERHRKLPPRLIEVPLLDEIYASAVDEVVIAAGIREVIRLRGADHVRHL